MKHKPWRAAETETAAAAETAPDQNHNIPEISNFGDIITTLLSHKVGDLLGG